MSTTTHVTNKSLSSHTAQITSFRAPDTLGCIWIAWHRLHPERKVSFPWGCTVFSGNSMSFPCSEKSEYSRFSRFVAVLSKHWRKLKALTLNQRKSPTGFTLSLCRAQYSQSLSREHERLTEKLNGLVENVHLLVAKAVLQQLLRHQMAHCNVQLLIVSVTRNVNHFHAVQQRRRNGRQRVGGRYEQNLWQVKRNIQVAANH